MRVRAHNPLRDTWGGFFMNKKNSTPVMRVRGIKKAFAENIVLNDISFDVLRKDRIGLVGFNGTGKTTLVKIIFGEIDADRGMIEKFQKPFKIGYLHQSADFSVHDFHGLYGKLEEEMLQKTSQLGLVKIHQWDHGRIDHLSRGEKLKLSLAKIWSTNPDMLILDEPTNHLDMQGLKWLITELEKFHGPEIIISHDRHFLDQTVNKIFELEDGKLTIYTGNYTDYRETKERNNKSQLHQYNVQQKHKEQIEGKMANLRNWSDKAHQQSTKQEGFKEYFRVKAKKMDQQVKSKMKRLEKELEKNKIERPKEEEKVMFQFDATGKRGKRIIEANNLCKRFGEHVLFENSHFYIKHGEKIGIIGGNGTGKTTFIKMLLGEEPASSGELWKSSSLKIAYLSQEIEDLPGDKNALEALGLSESQLFLKARTILANLGLKEGKIKRPIDELSLGERIRIKLTDLLLKEYDVLILDEPTNHLDLPSREQFEQTLSEYTGTLLVVSHDLYFLNKLSDRLLVFENNNILRLEMGLEEYQLNKQNSKRDQNNKIQEQELMIINNRITAILGEFSLLSPGEEKYSKLDSEFKQLLEEKQKLLGKKKFRGS